MKALIEETGTALLGCMAAGIIIALLMSMLSEGALYQAALRFAESIC